MRMRGVAALVLVGWAAADVSVDYGAAGSAPPAYASASLVAAALQAAGLDASEPSRAQTLELHHGIPGKVRSFEAALEAERIARL
mmetsp:Transcript_24091/g.81228  ORF Transcript_24091/g.81228 Transcript_24091/m.81228 type:complete len:85 (+) Transcript_24091:187-441(+)